MNSKRYIKVWLKHTGQLLTFDQMCDRYELTFDKRMITFSQQIDDDSYMRLATIPIENILYIEHCDCKK